MSLLRLPLRLTELVAVAATLVLGYLVTSHFSLQQDNEAPFVRSVSRHQVAHLTYADVRVLDVQAARFLAPLTSSSLVSPSGVFVLVTTELTATREPTLFGTEVLVDDRGRRYVPSEKSSCPINPEGQTGVPTYVVFCFEVPTRVLTQLHLQVARGTDLYKTTRYDDLADIDLAITAGEAGAMARTTTGYRVVEPSDRPFRLATVAAPDPAP